MAEESEPDPEKVEYMEEQGWEPASKFNGPLTAGGECEVSMICPDCGYANYSYFAELEIPPPAMAAESATDSRRVVGTGLQCGRDSCDGFFEVEALNDYHGLEIRPTHQDLPRDHLFVREFVDNEMDAPDV